MGKPNIEPYSWQVKRKAPPEVKTQAALENAVLDLVRRFGRMSAAVPAHLLRQDIEAHRLDLEAACRSLIQSRMIALKADKQAGVSVPIICPTTTLIFDD